MAITKYITPATYSAAYSPIPLRYSSDTIDSSDDLNYLVNVLYNKAFVTNLETYAYELNTYTKVTTSATYSFERGDRILIDDSANDDIYTGYYNVVDLIDSTSFVINLTLGVDFGGSVILAYNCVPYKNSADLEDECKIELQRTLSDFVDCKIEDTNDIYEGTVTAFDYDVMLGEEYDYVFEFEDNFFDTGNVGFYNSSITSLADVPFQIGDEIVVQQDLQEWSYNTISGSTGSNITLNSASSMNFRVGQQVTITGQSSIVSYNGIATITAVSGALLNITVTKPYVGTSFESGVVTGTPRPEYNRICRITNIVLDVTFGVMITTDMAFTDGTQPIGGKIKYVNRLLRDLNTDVETNRRCYNARFDKLSYGTNINSFDPYVIQDRTPSLNNISTILKNDERYRVELTSKAWLLIHVFNDTYADDTLYRFYDDTDTEISRIRLNNVSSDHQDYYTPIGIEQLIASTNTSLVSGSPLSTIKEDVSYYTVVASDSTNTVRSNTISFFVNTDCSKYEVYHLLWKDSLGSWITYPLIYLSADSSEYEKKNYYQRDTKWDLTNNTFGYPSTGRGETTFFGRRRDKILLSTGWVKEFENDLIKDMLGSSELFVQLPDDTIVACQIDNKSETFGKPVNDRRWNYQFTVRLARNEEIL